MLALIGSLIALAAGPLIYSRAQPHSFFGRALDGFVFVAIAGLVLLEVLPQLSGETAGWVIAAVILGLWGPSMIERLFHRLAHRMHMLTLLLAALGLAIHTIFEGAALTEGGSHSLDLAVILHRIPVGLAVWWLLRPHWGAWVPSLMLLAMAIGTSLGFAAGEALHVHEAELGFVFMQAFVAGSILHVVFNRPHMDAKMAEELPRPDRAEGIGSILGLGVFLAMLASEVLAGHAPLDGLQRLSDLALAAAPALLLAYLAGGLMMEFMPDSSVNWLSRGGAFSQAARGVAVGLPLPVCSCGVVPLYHSLIQRGAPPAAAMAFLIATPELGLDAILVSFPLLGWDMTMARLLAAAVVALLVGYGIGRWVQVREAEPTCCAQHGASDTSTQAPWLRRVAAGVRYGFVDLLDATAPWVLLGLIVAAAAQPLLQEPWLQAIPAWLQVVMFALIGLPLYVCATGSTPIVAAMLMGGVAPGAALAFLLTGPATNPATFGVLARLHGKKAALGFGLMTAGLAIVAGLMLNPLEPSIKTSAADLHVLPLPLAASMLFVLGALVLFSIARRGARRFWAELNMGSAPHAHD